MKKQKGFTILELLIVVAIIGVLTAVVMASLTSAKQKSRDARRLSDMEQIQHGLNLYFTDHSLFPIFATPITVDGTDAFSQVLVGEGYMMALPRDPSPSYGYTYVSNGAGTDYQLSFCLEGNSIINYSQGCGNTISP